MTKKISAHFFNSNKMTEELGVYEGKEWDGHVSPACTAPFTNLYINFPKKSIKMCCMASHPDTLNLRYNLGKQIENNSTIFKTYCKLYYDSPFNYTCPPNLKTEIFV